jgi:hypothetical protein
MIIFSQFENKDHFSTHKEADDRRKYSFVWLYED